MKSLLLAVLAVVALDGCSSSLTPQAQTALTTVCAEDAIIQPQAVAVAGVVSSVAPLAGAPGAAAAATIAGATGVDEAVIHPAVQDLCQKALTGTPAPSN